MEAHVRAIGSILTALAVCALATSVAAAGDPPGRYTMSPAEGGGFVRLDSQTGQMALCRQRDQQWACQDMAAPGPAVGEELARLRTENQTLKSEIRKLEEMMMGDDKRASGRRAERPGGEGFKLPSEQDVDQAMDYLGRMLRKFRDKIKELDGDGKGTQL